MSASVSLAAAPLVTLAKEFDEDKVTPGVLGFIVFAVLALAVWGLMKSMNKHMSRVNFEERSDDGGAGAEASSSGRGADSESGSGSGSGSGSEKASSSAAASSDDSSSSSSSD